MPSLPRPMFRIVHRDLLTLAVLLFAATPMAARTLRVPQDHPTIGEAIANAGQGDVIEVGPGTYREVRLGLRQRMTIRSTDGPATTIIDGEGRAPVFDIGQPLTREAVIEGFTIRGGAGGGGEGGGIHLERGSPTIRGNVIRDNTATDGAGIKVREGADPLVVDNVLRDNQATNAGGGIQVVGAQATIRGNTLSSNTALGTANANGGGIQLNATSGVVRVEDNRFEGNRSAFAGGGLSALAASVALVGNTFEENESGIGGGAHLEGLTIEPVWTIRDNLFLRNAATSQGGGLNLFAKDVAATVVVEDNELRGNTAFGPGCVTGSEGSCAQGGGMRTSRGSGTETWRDNLFVANRADLFAAALLHALPEDGKEVDFVGNRVLRNRARINHSGVACQGMDRCSIARTVFEENSLTGGPSTERNDPGALFLQDVAEAVVENSAFVANVGRFGGAIQAQPGSGPEELLLRNNSFLDNATANGNGGTVFTGVDTTFVNNLFVGDSRGIALSGAPAVEVDVNDFHGFTAGVFRSGAGNLATVAALNGQAFAAGNLGLAPGLADPADPHLAASSPLIDRADCSRAPGVDLDGDPRPLGAGCDIGADEFTAGPPPCVADGQTLCLVDGIFEVTANSPRSLFDDEAGQVAPVLQADFGGAFHFFRDEENFHVVVKILARPAGTYAVTAAGGEKLEWTIRIRDTRTDEVREYFKPFPELAVPVDPTAFPVDVPGARPAAARAMRGVGAPRGVARSNGPCTPDLQTLCLVDGRFEVSAVSPRSLFPGEAGQVAPVLQADFGGAFHFFRDEENFHVVVKILLRPAGTYAVTAAGGEKLEWTIRIRDTRTGEVRDYFKPFPELAIPVDPTAFPE